MDKKKHPSLDELLNQVRHSEPVIGEEEAIEWLNAQEGKPLSTSRVKTKTIIMTSIIATIGLIGLVWVNGPNDRLVDQSTTDITTPNEILDNRSSQTGSEEANPNGRADDYQPQPNENNSPSVGADNHLPPSEIINPITPIDTPRVDTMRVVRKIIMDTEKETQGSGEENVEVEEIEMLVSDQKVQCQAAPTGVLKLDQIALQNIGIVADKGLVLYKKEKTVDGTVEIQFENQNLYRSNYRISGLKHQWGDKVIPIAVTACDGNLVYAPKRGDADFAETIKAAIAVYVPADKKDSYYIFWFERNKDFLELLPKELSYNLKYEDLYHVELPKEQERNTPPTYGANNPVLRNVWLDKSELIQNESFANKLGIELNGDGFVVQRNGIKMSQGGTYMSSVNIVRFKKFDEVEQWENEDINKQIPFYITSDSFSLNGFDIITTPRVGLENLEPQDELMFERYRLVGFSFNIPELGTRIFWYPYSPAIKSILSPEQRAMVEARLEKVDPKLRFGYIRPEYHNIENLLVEEGATTEALNAIELNPETLKKLGIEVTKNGSIVVESMDYKSNYLTVEFRKYSSKVFVIQDNPYTDSLTIQNLKLATNNLMCITDDLGTLPRMYVNKEYDMKLLIPVFVNTGLTYSLYDKIHRYHRPNLIFWFVPTPEILAIIESGGQEAIWGEVKSTEIPDTTSEGVDCRYTEVCRNKVGVFHDQKIFPNPAAGYSNFSWTAQEASDYSIKLYALNGKEVRAYEGLKSSEGKNQYMMDLSNLPPGIYMVILTSAKGDEMHERLVVRE